VSVKFNKVKHKIIINVKATVLTPPPVKVGVKVGRLLSMPP
jgi:hypothetical protein